MYYEFYLDVYFLENLVMNYALLRITNKLLGCSATHLRSLLSAAVSSAASVCIILLYRYSMISTILVSVAANTLMVRFGCKIKDGKLLVRGICLFYTGSAGMGMLFSNLRRMTGATGVRAFVVTTAAAYCCISLVSWICNRLKRKQQRICDVTLFQGGREIHLRGLYDTGNMLWDTTLQSYVSVIDIVPVKELLSEEAAEELAKFCQKDICDKPELLLTLKPHYIPYKCVGCEMGLLPAVVLDTMYLKQNGVQKVITHPVIAVDKTYSSSLRSYQMILNPNLIDS
ncbi:sigma-E processing peptidase SpoIIGA [Blautia liquoris]|uniref:Sigma-E processing peptidase SpoIIGA n=1 Tax=Blautia liquoris TaxID=2779518 RepID=A0A7M2RIS8_9FIRM|nr:sigma-E processing peptidase SpoIIGA [Blautia liquoris]QOV20233.1 sigma-E processing peptidase SpoIIGA [Blautia liquoris]